MGSTAQGMDGTVQGPSVDWNRHEAVHSLLAQNLLYMIIPCSNGSLPGLASSLGLAIGWAETSLQPELCLA